ncbi:MAG: ABC transporter ATP-binding protein [Ignavibacteria bacterium]|nr:ABC transporter ATP-binding protein [Ignavibacteria bacterium]
MKRLRLNVREVTKQFNRRTIFEDISFSLTSGESLSITGRNGSGKSTLVKIIAGVLTPTRGSVEYLRGDMPIGDDDVKHELGLVSPYLQLYDEFSAQENLEILSSIRAGRNTAPPHRENLFRLFNLWHRKHDIVRTFSSGMKQRLKYIYALDHRPSILILDEPTSNLDEEGITSVRHVVEDFKKSSIVILATNDQAEANWCDARVHLG